jgi:dTDP-4-amino-4,6-dideoxygalactose transaminase
MIPATSCKLPAAGDKFQAASNKPQATRLPAPGHQQPPNQQSSIINHQSKNLNRIFLSSPHMGGTELDYVHEAFDTNWIAPLGANVNGFEEDLARYTGRKHAAAITTGTAGIHLALILCGVQPGDEVFCQSFTFAASANPIRYQGAVPVFIDSEPDTWNMCPDVLERALAERAGEGERGGMGEGKQPATGNRQPAMPKAIIVVHLYGMPAKMDRIMEIANRYGVPVIEDSAEALGSSINGRKCGTYGKFSVLSFNGNKIITTSGGGALLSDDEELIRKARFLATQARDDAPHYQHSELGYNYRMSNIVAGIGRGQMKVIDDRVAARRANHEFYFENLGRTWWQPSSVRRQEDLEALPTDSGHRVQDTGFQVQAASGKPQAASGKQQAESRRREENSGQESNPPLPPLGKGGSSFHDQESGSGNVEHETLNHKPQTTNLKPQTAGSPTGIYFLKEPAGYLSNRWLTTILVNPEETGGVTREDIRLALEEENIESRPLWKPMHMQPLYEDCEFYPRTSAHDSTSSAESSADARSTVELEKRKAEKSGSGSVSEWLFEHGLCLPSGSNLTDEDRQRVLNAINKVLGR